MTEELLPCPFCGFEVDSLTDATRIMGVWRLLHRCKVIGPIAIERVEKDRVILTWNTRALQDAKP
jgi:hypothetical protein